MSTFIVRFVGDTAEAFRGRARHVATGEEAVFSNAAELLAFMEGMNAVSGLGAITKEFTDSESSCKRGPVAPERAGARSAGKKTGRNH